jgi:hypothetical protein
MIRCPRGGELIARYGTFIFNGLLSPPSFIPQPEAQLRLPHEDDLEETGELPAAGAQGRAGYDVIPGSER